MTSDVLIGRDPERSVVARHVRDACGGRGSVLVVAGEAGVGKSTLLDAAVGATARAEGGPRSQRVLVGCAMPGNGAFRALAEALAPTASAEFCNRPELLPYGSALSALLPGWQQPPRLPQLSVVDSTVVFGEAVLHLLIVVAEQSKLLVLRLEDLQWADADTLGVLNYLRPRITSLPVLVVATARSEEGSWGSYDGLARGAGLSVLNLTRLDRGQTASASEATAGRTIEAAELDRLWLRSEGLPLLIHDLLDVHDPLGGADRSGTAAFERTAVPFRYGVLVAERLRRVPEAFRPILELAAVMGLRVDGRLLVQASTRLPGEVSAALRAGVQQNVLRIDPESGELGWRHAMTKEAVLAGLLPLERQQLAEAAAEALEGTDLARNGDGLLLTVDLFAAAGRDVDVARLVLQAVRESFRTGTHATAVDLLKRAEPGARLRPELAAQVAEFSVRALSALGRLDEAAAALARLLPYVEPSPSGLLHIDLARGFLNYQRLVEGESQLRRAGLPDDPHVVALDGQIALSRGDALRAVAYADRALVLAEQELAGSRPDLPASSTAAAGRLPAAICDALVVRARALRRADPLQSQADALRASEIAAEHDFQVQRVTALGLLSLMDVYDGRGVARLEDSVAVAYGCGLVVPAMVLRLHGCGAVAAAEGHAAVVGDLTAVVEESKALGTTEVQALALFLLSMARLFGGDAGAARALSRLALDAAPQVADARWAECVPALEAWLAGDVDGAVGMATEVTAALDADPAALPNPLSGLFALLRTGSADRTAADQLRASPSMLHVANVGALAYADALLAVEARASGGVADRWQKGDAALAAFPYWRHVLHLAMVPACLERQLEGPTRWLREAWTFLDTRAEPGLRRRCRILMDDAGVAVPRRRGDSSSVPKHLRALGVTGREYQVLTLVAERHSNASIARLLFLSPRTVETHVAHLLRRTGAADRESLGSRLAAPTAE